MQSRHHFTHDVGRLQSSHLVIDIGVGRKQSQIGKRLHIRRRRFPFGIVLNQNRGSSDIYRWGSQQIGMEGSSGSNRGVSGYTVDSKGNIDFPVLGEIHIAGMTREEVAAYIKKELQSHDLIKDPVVTVEYMNLSVAVMGEVNNPGRFSIDKDNLTILDALSQAGDLTIYGKREKVLVLRKEEGKQRVYGVNLCSAEHLYTSPAYYLQQNDVVYVEPNATKARQSTVNGNNVRSTSFWISLASLLTSIAVLIAK